jgi:protein-disulfide isomerase
MPAAGGPLVPVTTSMASRTKQKEEARARRLAEEQAQTERSQRQRRMFMLGGVLLLAVAVVAVAIAISSSGGSSTAGSAAATPKTPQQQQQQTQISRQINGLLAGLPQSGNTLGSPRAPVTVTEFGDLQCPVCRDFALTSENQLIANEVKAGKVKLLYKSLQTATPDPATFGVQQSAALAAGKQNKSWNFILLFYHEQGAEGSGYVNAGYLAGLARQIPGLNFTQWQTDTRNPTQLAQVQADENSAQAQGFTATPSITIQGPKGPAPPIVGPPSYSDLQARIKQVS